MRWIKFTATLLLLSNCSALLPKDPWYSGFHNYSEIKISENRYRIYIGGNNTNRTPPDQIKDFVLLRSAEIALEKHLKYFTIDSTEVVVGKTTLQTVFRGIRSKVLDSPPAVVSIVVYLDKPPSKTDKRNIYDALDVVVKIRDKYKGINFHNPLLNKTE